MPFTHKILAYCEATEELKDSQQLEESAERAWELAREYAESITTEQASYRPIVRVEVVAKA